jgi:hypothetical protein
LPWGGTWVSSNPCGGVLQTRLADANPIRKDSVHQASPAPAMRLVRDALGAWGGVAEDCKPGQARGGEGVCCGKNS